MKFKRTVFLYILSQIIPTFLLGIVVFVVIMLMFRFLKLTEMLLQNEAGLGLFLELLSTFAIGLMPIILPMSLLFSVLLTYSRLSTDSEIVALKSLGYSPFYLALPSIFFSMIISVISAQTLFSIGPIARLHSEKLLNNITSQQAMSQITAGTFAESFFDLVFYANEVDRDNNVMRDIFIYDRRNPQNPVAVVAKEGRTNIERNDEGQTASIVLTNGDMYKLASDSHTKVKFETYEYQIASPSKKMELELDPGAYTQVDLKNVIGDPSLKPDQRIRFQSEYQGRWALAASCLLFGFLGSALGSRTNRRSSASSGFVVSVICIIFYWVMYVVASNLSTKMVIHPTVALWLPNFLFLILTIWAWRHQSKS